MIHDDHKESKVEKGINLFNKLKALNVKPSDRTYAALKKMRNLKMSDSVAASLNEILEIAWKKLIFVECLVWVHKTSLECNNVYKVVLK